MHNHSPLLLETIKIEEGKIHNLNYHQTRLNKSQKRFYPKATHFLLSSHIIAPATGCYRCRVLYKEQIQSIEYIPYNPSSIRSIQLIESDITYDYKYANRSSLEALKYTCTHADEILIIKEGLVTDTSIANIAFYDGKQWVTPSTPLLQGTMRAKLLSDRFLQEKVIREDELSTFTHVALINAMIGFNILKNITLLDTQGKAYDY